MRAVRGPIVVLTGAGISHESGLDLFRSAGGIWSGVRIEDVATPDAFRRDPDRVQRFYDARRRQLVGGAIEANAAHRALARRAREWPWAVTLLTQNVDDLHERAGHAAVLHLHGALRSARCLACGATTAHDGDLAPGPPCPACSAPALRPDVVWFGEVPRHLETAETVLAGCALFVAIGTSGSVHPAAGFVERARGHAWTVELNLEPTRIGARFDLVRQGAATAIVPEFVAALLGGGS